MPHPKNQVIKVCEACQTTFSVKMSQSSRRFCSWKCRVKFGNSTKCKGKCPICDKSFSTYKAHPKKYCSISCGITARNLTDKNPSYHRDISGEKNPMFGKEGCKGAKNGMFGRTGSDSPAFKGGRKIRKDGYILVLAHKHPYASIDGYVLEHRLIMEKHLGRYLKPTEVVHHIDGNTSKNAFDNLKLFKSQTEHVKIGHPEQMVRLNS
ncbi:MAG: HNH endonuclease [Dehalococcoidia bacterium]|nr:HNH endonuclease [Dehalococcoidia bacterium]